MVTTISKIEFIIAMDSMRNLGVKRLPDEEAKKRVYTHSGQELVYIVPVPEYEVSDFKFENANGRQVEIVPLEEEAVFPEYIFKEAKEKLGESKNGEYFTYDKISSVYALITVILILQKKYSRENLEKYVNKTYLSLPERTGLASAIPRVIYEENFPKLHDLNSVISEFISLVDPFSFGNEFRSPVKYLNKINISFSTGDDESSGENELEISGKKCRTKYFSNKRGVKCEARIRDSNNEKELNVVYDFEAGDSYQFSDEWIEATEINMKLQKTVNLRISLKTGISYSEGKPLGLVTREQKNLMIGYLEKINEKIRKKILYNMISTK